MYTSLTKINNLIIPEDPKEYEPDTPKRKKHKKQAKDSNKKKTDMSTSKIYESRGRETLTHQIKINTLRDPLEEDK